MSITGPDPMNAVQKFFLDPTALSKRNDCGKVLAFALSVITGLATLGLVHMGFWIHRKVQVRDTDLGGATKSALSKGMDKVSTTVRGIFSPEERQDMQEAAGGLKEDWRDFKKGVISWLRKR